MIDKEMKKIIEDAGYTVLKTEDTGFVLKVPVEVDSCWEDLRSVYVWKSLFFKDNFVLSMRGDCLKQSTIHF